ncbi:MAG: long-chain fatty acid--CoA ligase [Acidobacteriaceae bacterium]|nr:long-chain fatty acid--CoA ligase [Acidobacteriaceae bacterium]
MLELKTINDVLLKVAERGDAAVAFDQANGSWKAISGAEMLGRVRAVMQTLERWGIRRGDRVALVSENRWEWPVVDFAVLALGAVDVPLYQTLTPEQMGFILRDSGTKAIFVSSREQYEKLVQAGDLPELEHVAVFDDGEFSGAESFTEILKPSTTLSALTEEFRLQLAEIQPDELASIIYTSGTTGDPKGVMLTHRNLAENLRYSTDGLRLQAGDTCISFLPLSHALARHLDYALYANAAVIYYLAKFDQLPQAMKTVHPAIFLAVPRVFEKVRQAVEGKSEGLKKKILVWALGVGAKHRGEVAAGRKPGGLSYAIADKLVFSKIREAFGGQAKLFVSGGAPLGKESSEWFLDVGIRVFEGYGLTETSPVISRNTYEGYRMGTVGTTLENVEVRVAADGEIEVRGDSIFTGYWKKEEATRKEFTEDGWFKTGDIGTFESGFLTITDRKKELLKTSGGKFVAPQPIEGKLKVDPLVNQVALIGDNHKFVSVLISPNLKALEGWAQKNGVVAGDAEKLVADPRVQKLFAGVVEKVNGSLAHFESIKKFRVVPEEWNVDSGELTPSMKLKRRVINEKYQSIIKEIYAE